MDLFERASPTKGPLADRMRPRRLAEVVGQRHIVGEGRLLARAIAGDVVPSMVLAGPPGTGKTTLAHVIAEETKARFVSLNAVLSGVADLRAALEQARELRLLRGTRTLLFVDEIHRFNKAQQDALLPHVERGDVTFVGATTENPSFAVNAALLSRARVFVLEPLSPDDLVALLERALGDAERGIASLRIAADREALVRIARSTDGDARRALTALEVAATHVAADARVIDLAAAEEALAGLALRHDRSGDDHYDLASALIKSMRGTDADAAIYYAMRLVEAGDDPQFLLRRLVVFASEDVGNADPRALEIALAADAAFRRVGMPEGLHALAQAVTYLATAPKSNASYVAFTRAREDVRRHGALPVPKHLRNAPTAEMKARGLGEGYRYPHDHGGYVKGEQHLPEALAGTRYYQPKRAGYEGKIREYLIRIGARREDES